jgi:uncharacterized membrane protein
MPLVQKLSTDSYAAYFIHPVVVVGCIFVVVMLVVIYKLVAAVLNVEVLAVVLKVVVVILQ